MSSSKKFHTGLPLEGVALVVAAGGETPATADGAAAGVVIAVSWRGIRRKSDWDRLEVRGGDAAAPRF